MTCRPRRHCLLSLIGTMAGLVLATGGPAAADAFRLLAWNVESNRPDAPTTSDPRVIATQLVALLKQPETRAGIVTGLSGLLKQVFIQTLLVSYVTDLAYLTALKLTSMHSLPLGPGLL